MVSQILMKEHNDLFTKLRNEFDTVRTEMLEYEGIIPKGKSWLIKEHNDLFTKLINKFDTVRTGMLEYEGIIPKGKSWLIV